MVGLIILFSFSVAVSLLWLGGVGFYVFAKIGFPQLFGLPAPEIAMVTATAFLPVVSLWLVVGLLYNSMTLKKQSGTINLLLAQTRRSADHAEAMVRTLMETQLQTRSAMVLHNADLFINELNDLLSDILVRFGLLQPAHTELVWQRVGDGNRWAFCKVLLLNAENSPRFKDDLKAQMMRDDILSNALRMFCYRFEQMFTMLERHDIEHYLTKIFEEGSMGRVYLRFVEACREVDAATNVYAQEAYEPDEAELSQQYEQQVYQAQAYGQQGQSATQQQEESDVQYVEEVPVYEYEQSNDYDSSAETKVEEENAETYYPDPEPAEEVSEEPVANDITSSPFGFLRPTR